MCMFPLKCYKTFALNEIRRRRRRRKGKKAKRIIWVVTGCYSFMRFLAIKILFFKTCFENILRASVSVSFENNFWLYSIRCIQKYREQRMLTVNLTNNIFASHNIIRNSFNVCYVTFGVMLIFWTQKQQKHICLLFPAMHFVCTSCMVMQRTFYAIRLTKHYTKQKFLNTLNYWIVSCIKTKTFLSIKYSCFLPFRTSKILCSYLLFFYLYNQKKHDTNTKYYF